MIPAIQKSSQSIKEEYPKKGTTRQSKDLIILHIPDKIYLSKGNKP